MTISSTMNVLMKFVISITLSFAFSFSEYDDMHPVYPVPCPWLSVVHAAEEEAEQRLTHLSGQWEICPRSGRDEQARNA